MTEREQPWLGLATTRELLDELRARIEMHALGGLDYRTVDGEIAEEVLRRNEVTELRTEIERLTAIVQQHEIWQASLVQQLVDKDAEIERLRTIIGVADILRAWWGKHELQELTAYDEARAALEPKP